MRILGEAIKVGVAIGAVAIIAAVITVRASKQWEQEGGDIDRAAAEMRASKRSGGQEDIDRALRIFDEAVEAQYKKYSKDEE